MKTNRKLYSKYVDALNYATEGRVRLMVEKIDEIYYESNYVDKEALWLILQVYNSEGFKAEKRRLEKEGLIAHLGELEKIISLCNFDSYEKFAIKVKEIKQPFRMVGKKEFLEFYCNKTDSFRN